MVSSTKSISFPSTKGWFRNQGVQLFLSFLVLYFPEGSWGEFLHEPQGAPSKQIRFCHLTTPVYLPNIPLLRIVLWVVYKTLPDLVSFCLPALSSLPALYLFSLAHGKSLINVTFCYYQYSSVHLLPFCTGFTQQGTSRFPRLPLSDSKAKQNAELRAQQDLVVILPLRLLLFRLGMSILAF